MSNVSCIRRRAIGGSRLTAVSVLVLGVSGDDLGQTAPFPPRRPAVPSIASIASIAPVIQVAPTDSVTTIEEVVVTGTRSSLRSAIERKRGANTSVDSIVAEDVSEFPDKNVGEEIARDRRLPDTRTG